MFVLLNKIMKNLNSQKKLDSTKCELVSNYNKLLMLSISFLFLNLGQSQSIDSTNGISFPYYDSALSECTDNGGTPDVSDKNTAIFIDKNIEKPDILKQAIKKENKGLHLFSHGKPGKLLINDQWLQKEEIAKFLNSKFKIKNLKSLNIYGCSFAKGELGLKAVVYLEKELDISIAASTNITGADGDWVLETANNGTNASQVINPIGYTANLQLDTKHYIPPHVGALYSNVYWDDEEIILSTPSTTSFQVTVTTGNGNPVAGSPFTISKSNPARFDFNTTGSSANPPISVDRSSLGAKYTGDRGLIATASEPFLMEYRHEASNASGKKQATSYVAKGETAFGSRFRWAVPESQLTSNRIHSYLSIMAVEPSTIDITGINSDTDITNVSHNGSLNVTLDAGESIIYEVKGPNNPENIRGHVGAKINSTGDIVVNTGGQNIQATNQFGGGGQDHGIDQLVPVEKLGRNYTVIAGEDPNGEGVFITADQNNTDVTINGGSTTTIQAGDQLVIDGNPNFTNGSMSIETSKPAYVHHAIKGSTNSGQYQDVIFIAPLSIFSPTTVEEIGFAGNILGNNFITEVTVVTETGATLTIEENGTALSLPPATAITGANFEYRKLSITPNSNIAAFSNGSVQLVLSGRAGVAYFAGYFSGFGALPVIEKLPLNCSVFSSGVRLGIEDIFSTFDSFQWYKDGSPISGATSPNFNASDYGDYFVRVYNGAGSFEDSNTIVVNSDDFDDTDTDNDNVINNTCDLDDDNDGILDTDECSEVNNDFVYHLFDLGGTPGSGNNLSIYLQEDGLWSPFINVNPESSELFVETNATDSFNNLAYDDGKWYYLDNGDLYFTDDIVNTDFTLLSSGVVGAQIDNLAYDNGTFYHFFYRTATNTVELYSSTNPSVGWSKVCDTELSQDQMEGIAVHDGVFYAMETPDADAGSQIVYQTTDPCGPISNWSSSTSNGAEFGTNVKNLAIGNADALTFCDTDGDGIPDYLDLDSDNDGIPDVVEAGGVDEDGDGVIDSFTDTDNDGVDDTVGTSGLGIVDNDGDGIPNSKDLDSDNDGTPDIIEAGGTDTDNDGIQDDLTDNDGDGFADPVDGDVGNDGTAENTAGALVPTGSDANGDGLADDYPNGGDFDGDGVLNQNDLDGDGDGILDTQETGAPDADADGIVDGSDNDDNGWNDSVDPGEGGTAPSPSNTDGTGESDYLDLDADDDGIPDNIEGQATDSYTAPSNTDTDGDGIDDAYDNDTANFGGNTNNGVTPENTDGTDDPDYLDDDTDNDGTPDIEENGDTD
ncbi:MAG: DUF4347 domain-containing protein, partial [Bacteroidetes bacterium]|nr:DUF4347 domain-containing protein [Bacteroidota bacterium]